MRCRVAAATARSVALLALSVLSGCSAWFFTGDQRSLVDRSRPIALLETTGGVELAATTEFGVLSLGRTAKDGPCRVHYFLGPTPLIESGELQPTGSIFTAAVIDLKTQRARALDRSPTGDDALWVMWTPDGQNVESVPVALARGDGLDGDLLHDPGTELPAGATVLCRGPKGEALFAGLITGHATVESGPASGSYYVFAGVDRVRELLAVPSDHPIDEAPVYRTDDITVMKPVNEQTTAKRAEGNENGEGGGQ